MEHPVSFGKYIFKQAKDLCAGDVVVINNHLVSKIESLSVVHDRAMNTDKVQCVVSNHFCGWIGNQGIQVGHNFWYSADWVLVLSD